MDNLTKFFLAVMSVFVGFTMMVISVMIMHEQAHQSIFRYYNVSTHIEYGWSSFSTVVDANQTISEEKMNTLLFLNSMNETGYQTIGGFVMVGALLVLMICIKLKQDMNV